MKPERAEIERLLLDNHQRKACEIADEVGVSVDYVRNVKRSMRRKGQIAPSRPATDQERLEDLTALLQKRNGRMSHKAAANMLMHNCYYRLRSQDDSIHASAIDDTYTINNGLKNPLPMSEAIKLCEIAVEHYMRSINKYENERAIELGYPGAGLNYSDRAIKDKWEIKDHELPLVHMR